MKSIKIAWIAVALCVCAFVSSAKTTNLTESVVLTKDTDWRGQGIVLLNQDGAIDLGGHVLWTDGIAGAGDGDLRVEDMAEPDADGTHVTTSTLGSGTGAVLFDNDFSYRMQYSTSSEINLDTNKNHRVLGSNVSSSNPLWIIYDFKAATCISGYRICFQSSSSSDRAPKAWVFEGSDDKSAWTVLDERTDETGWKNPESRSFAFDNDAGYRYYRLRITSSVSGQYVELYQLEFFGNPSAARDLTTDDAMRAFSSTTLQDGTAATLFDNRFTFSSHRILVNGGNYFPARFGYDFGKPTSVSAYRIYYHSTYSDDPSYGGAVRSPRAWTFEGTDDTNANNWTVLDRRDNTGNAMKWKNPDVRTFDVPTPGSFRYYRLNIEGSVSTSVLELYQLEFLGSPAVRSNPTSHEYGRDLTTADASRVSSTSTLVGGSAKTLFDDQFIHTSDHRALMNSYPFEVTYDFGTAQKVRSYRIYYWNNDASTKNARAPKAWSLKGSNDKTGGWTVIDRREGYTNWADVKDAQTFAVADPGDYRYYQMEVQSAVGGYYAELYQLEYFPTEDSEARDLTTDASKASTTSTLYAGTPAVLFDNDISYRANTSSGTLFDTNANHRILLQGANLPLTVDYDFCVPTVVNGYKIYFNNSSGNAAPDRAPKAWTFEGTDDPDGLWTVLDTRKDITGWTKGGANMYFFTNGTAYRYYRLNVTAINGSNLELYQLEYFNRPAGELHLDIDADAVVSNRTVALEGSVKLVKDGEGTFVAVRENQGYFGGTDVDAGTLRAGADGASAPLGATNGSSASPCSTVTVSPGGVFDIGGLGGWSNYPIVLNGGKLVCNSGAGVTDTFRNISQTAASSIEISSAFTMGDGTGGGALDLGGYELDVNLLSGGSWTIGLQVVSNGKLVTLVNGQEASQGTRLASWDAMPSFNDVKLFHARAEEDGLYSYRPGSMIIIR